MRKFIVPLAAALWRRYSRHDVSHQAAALAYFLLFSLFPILILSGSLIGRLDADLSGILSTLSHILPERFLALVESYLSYASAHTGQALMFSSLILSVWFPMRSTDCLMHAVRRAYALSEPEHPLLYRCKVLLYTALLLFSIALTLLLATLSRSAVVSLSALWGLPDGFAQLWGFLRFLVMGLIVFAALGALYAAAQDGGLRLRAILPGALLSTLAWITLSAVYSFYSDYISDYDHFYGTLSTAAVILIWLYLTAVTLIMGAELNAALPSVLKNSGS